MPAPVGVEYKLKRMFFDRAAVSRLIGKKNASGLSRIGSYIRRRARSSLRRRKRVSAPGQTPSVHSDSDVATLKNIWFAYDPKNQSVVIGPLRLHLHSALWDGGGRALTTGAVPGIMEHGGRVGIRKMKMPDGTWQRVPFGHRRRDADRLVPVWKATAAEKAAATGVVQRPMKNRPGRMANFYVIKQPPSVIVWVNVAARPFMGPALAKERGNPKLAGLWAGTTSRAA